MRALILLSGKNLVGQYSNSWKTTDLGLLTTFSVACWLVVRLARMGFEDVGFSHQQKAFTSFPQLLFKGNAKRIRNHQCLLSPWTLSIQLENTTTYTTTIQSDTEVSKYFKITSFAFLSSSCRLQSDRRNREHQSTFYTEVVGGSRFS